MPPTGQQSGGGTAWHARGLLRSRERRSGTILLMILVMIVVLSSVIVQFTEKGLTEIAAEGHYVERDRLRLTAFSALETTLAVLADYVAIDGGLTSPAQGWADPLAIAGFEPEGKRKVTVSFTDESGKLPINSLDEGTLFLLFNEMGFDADDSLILTNALLDWIDEDDEERIDGAESQTYAAAEWPFGASNRPLTSLEELAVVKGFRELFFDEAGRPNAYYRTLEDTVSVWADGTLNVNAVSELALRAYAGFSDPQIQALETYLAGADGMRGTEDDRYFANNQEIAQVLGELPQGVSLSAGITTLRIRVEVSEPDGRYALEAVVQPANSGGGGPVAAQNGSGRQQPRANDPRQQQQQRRAGSGAGQADLQYPFVFLELTEDVGQNLSISAPVEPAGGDERLDADNRPVPGA